MVSHSLPLCSPPPPPPRVSRQSMRPLPCRDRGPSTMLTPGPCQSIRLHGRPEEGTWLERFDSTKMSFCGLRRVPSDAEIILSLLFSACSPTNIIARLLCGGVSLGPHFVYNQRH